MVGSRFSKSKNGRGAWLGLDFRKAKMGETHGWVSIFEKQKWGRRMVGSRFSKNKNGGDAWLGLDFRKAKMGKEGFGMDGKLITDN